ncbi:MAG: aminotransferase class I/II-fold pyridoxal phosphate-dependent enzyme [Saprospiraceae bacterium]|nr:aminotransferase class I/II-fold pyridoxal phosphate-dependent enzyme [Saprospiraceae bacterium]
MQMNTKLPNVGTSIFSVMSKMANEYNAINLSQGFPNYSSDRALINRVSHHMKAGHNQYAPMAGLPILRQRIAEKINRLYQVTVDPAEEINITAGATQAIFTALSVLVHPGDEVVLFEPAYDSYRPAIELFGGVPIIYQLEGPDFSIDWARVKALTTDRTRLIIINTPHNPTGVVFSKSDMLALSGLVKNTSMWGLSDEVYEHIIYDGQEHHTILKYSELRQRSVATYSFGKTFHNTGWKIGYLVGPSSFMHEYRKVHQFNVFSVNTPMQYALADHLTDPARTDTLSDFYQQKRDFFGHLMDLTPLRPLTCSGTYFQCFGYGHISQVSDVEFASWLTQDIGVAAIPVSAFNSSGHDDRVIRLCFAKTEDVLMEAGKRLSKLK